MKYKAGDYVYVRVADPNVEQGRRTYVGRVVSTGIDEMLVQRVPKRDGTEELVKSTDISGLAEKADCRYVHFAKVLCRSHCGLARTKEGYGFPFDMLRYDRCVPVNFTVIPSTNDGLGARIVVEDGADPIVARVARILSPGWTVGRWESHFGVKIEPIGCEKL